MSPRAFLRSLPPAAALLGFLAALPGCVEPTPTRTAAAHDTSIAAVHMHKCGACHVAPEPGTRTREHLEDAFGRHRSRVHLTRAQWTAMVDYLAAPAGATTWQPP